MTYDLTGKRFGRLIVIDRQKNNPSLWFAYCDCSQVVADLKTADLTSGRRKSCGCMKRAIYPQPTNNPAALIMRRRLEKGQQVVSDGLIEFANNGEASKGKHLLIRWAFMRQNQKETHEDMPQTDWTKVNSLGYGTPGPDDIEYYLSGGGFTE